MSPCLWDRSWIKLKIIYCSSSAHFKNSKKFLRIFFILPRFNVSLVPPLLWNGSQLILKTVHFYSPTHFIFFSTNPASFPNFYRILFFHFFQVDVSEIEIPTKKIFNNIDLVVSVASFDFQPKFLLNLISNLIWLTIWFPVELTF